MKSRRRSLAAIGLTGALGLAACGGGSSGDSAPSADAPLAEPETTGEVFSEADDASTPAPEPDAEPTADLDPEPDADAGQAAEPAADPVAEAEPDADAEASTQAEPEPASEPAPTPAPAVLGGRSIAAELQPAADFDGNPFPDLIVNDVGRNAETNIRNILPSDRPVLLWSWAPH